MPVNVPVAMREEGELETDEAEELGMIVEGMIGGGSVQYQIVSYVGGACD